LNDSAGVKIQFCERSAAGAQLGQGIARFVSPNLGERGVGVSQKTNEVSLRRHFPGYDTFGHNKIRIGIGKTGS